MPAYFRTDDLWSGQMSRKRKRDDNESEMTSWFKSFKEKIFGANKNAETTRKLPRIDSVETKPHQSSNRHLTSTPKHKVRQSHSWFKFKDRQKFAELIQKHLIDEENTPQIQNSTQTEFERPIEEITLESTGVEKTIVSDEDEKKRLREKCEKGAAKDCFKENLPYESVGVSQIMPESVTKARDLFARKSQYFDTEWLSNLKQNMCGEREQERKQSQEQEECLKKVKEETREQKEKVNKVLKKRLNDKELTVSLYSLYITQPAEEEKDEVVITDEMENLIDKSLKGTPDEVLIEEIKRKDLHTLLGLNWLNDEIINGYFALIEKENKDVVKCFNTFFYKRLKDKGFQGVKRWTKKFDLFSYSLVLIPLHLQVHWTLIAVMMDKKEIHYYDSMATDGSMSGNKHLNCILSYLEDEHKDKRKGQTLDANEWKLIEETDIPSQLNGSDCGMFCCKYAYYLSKGKRFSFDQSLMPLFRRRMIYELVTQTLL